MATLFSPDPAVAKNQMLAIVFLLTAFGHMDGKFGLAEKRFVQEKIAALVEARMLEAVTDPLARQVTTARVTAQFQRVAATIDAEIVALFSESVAEGESSEQFVHAKLALRCYELLHPFDEQARANLFDVVHELIIADGAVHPQEAKLRDDIQRLLAAPIEIEDFDLIDDVDSERRIVIEPAETLVPREDDHPFFSRSERAFPRDPHRFAKAAEKDIALVRKVLATLEEQRAGGAGKLTGVKSFVDFSGQAPFLDGHVYVVPPDPRREYELIVLGDLHGCYSCLKAALMQTDFLGKVQAHANDPENTPDTRLVLLGDYIDRGRFSYDGILRTVMRLFVTVPNAVHILRGNHEYYIEHQERILAPVRPAEGMMNLEGVAGDAFFKEYMLLFEALPTSLAFDRTFFAHAGIPRHTSLVEKWQDLSSLNDPDVRFEMMWSDPSDTEVVPDELQKAVARFGYGTQQFRSFLARIGCSVMIRGHERAVEGFRTTYDFPDATLLTLFSAGGATSLDLAETSNYREVTPMGLTLRWRDGVSRITPFTIDWSRYNDPARNRFLA
ncbi:MAG TPA: metallophosphoesterase family protein [Polyangiaceae bacterium]|nr:metallophosphoesterase family protein [Polyangiaceae bacterium]